MNSSGAGYEKSRMPKGREEAGDPSCGRSAPCSASLRPGGRPDRHHAAVLLNGAGRASSTCPVNGIRSSNSTAQDLLLEGIEFQRPLHLVPVGQEQGHRLVWRRDWGAESPRGDRLCHQDSMARRDRHRCIGLSRPAGLADLAGHRLVEKRASGTVETLASPRPAHRVIS